MLAPKTTALLLFLLMSVCALAESPVEDSAPVVIFSSYNPDVRNVSDNVAAFSKRYIERGCTNPIKLESLNALNLPESVEWQSRMWSTLSKYYKDGQQPAAVVLLGNEAVSTFFSIDREQTRQTPVVIGMRGDNMVKVTDNPPADLRQWIPPTYSLTGDFPDYCIVGGLLYSYDVEKTLAILEQLPRKIDTLAFISDNTFGGLTMLSFFKSEIDRLGKYPVKYLDGRNCSLAELNYSLSTFDEQHAVVIGTWRIDNSDSYVLSNTTHTLAFANENLPAVTLASVGLGHWAIGGYCPQYRSQGADLADDVADYLQTGVAKQPAFIPSKYTFDNDKLAFFGVTPHDITGDYILLNPPTSFFKENLGIIGAATGVILFLISFLVLTLVALARNRRMQTQLEEQLVAIRKANNANDAKTSFLFNMSHDIRTPMNAIIGFTDLLQKYQDVPEKREDYLNKIKRSSNVLLSIINNVLEMARIEKGTIVIEEKAWSANQFNDTLRSVFQEMMEQKGIEFTSSVEVLHPYVMCDPTKLREVFINILSNALKYTESGGRVEMHLQEMPSERGGYALYRTTITDTGIGMSEDFLPHLFEEFSRENNTTDNKIEGTGLGMPIVKRLVELMEGSIEVTSRKGEGTTIIVTLPHKITDEASLSAFVAPKMQYADFEGKHLLLAEDNDLNAEIAMEILSEVGLVVDRAEDGRRCVEMVEQAAPGYYDLILMDIQMPNMNGYDATRAIRALDDPARACIPILAMTANAFEEDKREAERAGMNGHLSKPIDVTELIKALAGVIYS